MIILAHRGASKQAPENTLKAFNLACEQGAHGIEFDVYQHSSDSIVIHDRWLNRTTNGTGLVLKTPFTQLRTLDAGEGEPIPTLSEVLLSLPANTLANIELKWLYDTELWLENLYKVISSGKLNQSNLIISSFNHNWLKEISKNTSGLRIAALTASYSQNAVRYAEELDAEFANIALDVVDRDFVEQAHRAGLKVLVYTVDHPEDMLMLQEWGVDGIFTNVPDVARKTLVEHY